MRVEIEVSYPRTGEVYRSYFEIEAHLAARVVRLQEAASTRRARVRAWIEQLDEPTRNRDPRRPVLRSKRKEVSIMVAKAKKTAAKKKAPAKKLAPKKTPKKGAAKTTKRSSK